VTSLQVDTLRFTFPAGWEVSKYDDWSFYQEQFRRMWNGIQAVDVLALDPRGNAWFIEAKDYRVHRRSKPSTLGEEVACKVFDTLAALLPTRVNGREPEEIKMATSVLGAAKIRVVLHLEQPRKHSALRPRAIDPASVLQELRRRVRAIDPHPIVAWTTCMGSLEWTVS
jgi:hypothetical protein